MAYATAQDVIDAMGGSTACDSTLVGNLLDLASDKLDFECAYAGVDVDEVDGTLLSRCVQEMVMGFLPVGIGSDYGDTVDYYAQAQRRMNVPPEYRRYIGIPQRVQRMESISVE